ncbi:hypothetical protein CBL_02862 [Carabus blaptoides fortunei]
MATPSLNPKLPDQNLLQQKEKNKIGKQKHDFDRRHGVRTLKPVQPGDRVWITSKWSNSIGSHHSEIILSKNTKRRGKTKPSTSYPQHGKPVPGGRGADRARHPGRTTTTNGCRRPQRDLDRHSNHRSTSTDERNWVIPNSKRKFDPIQSESVLIPAEIVFEDTVIETPMVFEVNAPRGTKKEQRLSETMKAAKSMKKIAEKKLELKQKYYEAKLKLMERDLQIKEEITKHIKFLWSRFE